MKKKNPLAGILIVLVLLAAVAGAGGFYVLKVYDPAAASTDSGNEEYRHFTVESGMGTKAIANALQEEGLIENSFLFVLKSKSEKLDGKFQAGEYELSPSMKMSEMMEALLHGKKTAVRFTIPEGFTIKQTAERLEELGLADGEKFLSVCAEGDFDFDFLSGIEKGENRLEGFLFPDTYEISEGDSEETIIKVMLRGFGSAFGEKERARAEELGLSIREAVTIASLIEEETRKAEERPLVSSVIYNRLDKGMKLGFCSTVLYALGEQKPRLLYKDLEVDSPYNTYIHAGLPPAPISSPGKASIDAALYPADTNYLYFVLKEAGGSEHNFAESSSAFHNYKEMYLETIQ